MTDSEIIERATAAGWSFERVSLYDRGGGVLQRVIQAAAAVPRPGARDWLLQDVRIYDANMDLVLRKPQIAGLPGELHVDFVVQQRRQRLLRPAAAHHVADTHAVEHLHFVAAGAAVRAELRADRRAR